MFSTDYAVLLDTGKKKGAREMEKGARVKGQGRRDRG